MQDYVELAQVETVAYNSFSRSAFACTVDIDKELKNRREELRNLINKPENGFRFLNVGRLVHVQDGSIVYGWGIALSNVRAPRSIRGADPRGPSCLLIDIYVNSGSGDTEGSILCFRLHCVSRISRMRCKVPDDLRVLSKSLRRLPPQILELHPVDHMHIEEAVGLLKRISQLKAFVLHKDRPPF